MPRPRRGFWSVGRVAEVAGIGERSVRTMVDGGVLPVGGLTEYDALVARVLFEIWSHIGRNFGAEDARTGEAADRARAAAECVRGGLR